MEADKTTSDADSDEPGREELGKIRENGRKVGYVFEERFMWHTPWTVSYTPLVQPFQHWEGVETKRRFHNLLLVSGLYSKLKHLQPIEAASKNVIEMVHTCSYIEDIQQKSGRTEGSYCDTETTFSQYAFDIASLAVGGAIYSVDKVMSGEISSAYVLCRPPGHHALPDKGMGFCIFNNIAIAAKHLLQAYPKDIKRVAIVDYDVHHGNGTQEVFYRDSNVLFVSVHQDSNFPLNSGNVDDIGEDEGKGTTINIPLPPGSGSGAYKCVFDTIVIPALHRFKPDFILVSSGFDASYADPLSATILSSNDFRYMATSLIDAAGTLCAGRIAFMHEGGYSEIYVPFCGAAVIEAMLGVEPQECIKDPFIDEVSGWAGQELQGHQCEAVDEVAVLHNFTRPVYPIGRGGRDFRRKPVGNPQNDDDLVGL